MVKTLPSNAGGMGLIPRQGTTLHTAVNLIKSYYKCTSYVQKVIPET